ncbi:ASCH domain-containing protein [Chelonobacter oris]|uniref:N(4)-acetylcytidine aminohydrolase n=1 Tax=Chelonobacter oris TaxID=505317 RepID=UPI00244CA8E4|nr:N(4)-acetylcytidine aminohydrolase [Chelonobacter oris]MDH2999541.1 ASCH domain-containing protein [Chelonobacter oris]
MIPPTQITFFQRFEADILNGSKTITIRDQAESHYLPDSVVDVLTYETQRWFAKIRILSVTPITFNQLNQRHASQENMLLSELKEVIREIYPNETALWVLEFELIS